MPANIELEFKTKISEEKYNELIKEFELENNIFPQTNFYFDTPDLKLFKNNIVLRIRQKGENFKLTKKERGEGANEACESHVFLNEEKALDFLKQFGFSRVVIARESSLKTISRAIPTSLPKTSYASAT